MGKEFLSKGLLADALTHYHAAIGWFLLENFFFAHFPLQILQFYRFLNLYYFLNFLELEPDNYKTLYLRATVYLGMGKSKAAVPDLNAVLQLKPDFIAVGFFLFL